VEANKEEGEQAIRLMGGRCEVWGQQLATATEINLASISGRSLFKTKGGILAEIGSRSHFARGG
jgi:hypothetical protein